MSTQPLFVDFGTDGVTSMHPLVVACIVLTAGLMVMLHRRYVLAPFLGLCLLTPLSQQIVVSGVNCTAIRLILFIVLIAVGPRVLRSAIHLLRRRVSHTDVAVALWVIGSSAIYVLLHQELGAAIYKAGFMFNGLGTYYLFRHYVRTDADVDPFLNSLAVISATLAVVMTIEQETGRSVFEFIGTGHPLWLRNGHIRSQGPFAHSILAGAVGAILAPLFIGRLWAGRCRVSSLIGAVAATTMVVTARSSTPLTAYIAGLAAFAFWRFRWHMRALRWAAVAILCILHVSMKAPVWALIARLDLTGGSGWHRFRLVDEFIRRVGEWWLLGTTTNAEWGYEMWDRANWYVASGITGGVVGLVLFVSVIAYSFRDLGDTLRSCGSALSAQRFVWGVGASLAASSVAFCGINLFDQSITVWYALLAVIAATCSHAKPPHTDRSARFQSDLDTTPSPEGCISS